METHACTKLRLVTASAWIIERGGLYLWHFATPWGSPCGSFWWLVRWVILTQVPWKSWQGGNMSGTLLPRRKQNRPLQLDLRTPWRKLGQRPGNSDRMWFLGVAPLDVFVEGFRMRWRRQRPIQRPKSSVVPHSWRHRWWKCCRLGYLFWSVGFHLFAKRSTRGQLVWIALDSLDSCFRSKEVPCTFTYLFS